MSATLLLAVGAVAGLVIFFLGCGLLVLVHEQGYNEGLKDAAKSQPPGKEGQ